MSVIDRGELHWALDANRPLLSRTFNAWYNFQGAAQQLSAEQILRAFDAASDNNPEVATFTRTLRANPVLAERFRERMVNEGRDVVSEVNTLVARDGILTEDNVLAFMNGVSTELGQDEFSAHVNGVTFSTIDTAAEFFELVTTDNYTTTALTRASAIENSMPQLRVFADDPDFQQNLFDAAHQPGFFQYLQTLQAATGGSDSTFLQDFLSTPEGRETLKTAVSSIASEDFNGDFDAIGRPILEQAAVEAMTEIRESLRSLPAAERFAALRTAAAENDAIPNSAEAVFAALGQEGEVFEGLREAVGNAFAYNDSFAAFIVQRMGDGEGGSELTALLSNLNSTTAGPLTGILNNLANNPEMSTEALEHVIDTVSTHTRLMTELAAITGDTPEAVAARTAKNEEIAEATTEMYAAIRAAGGALPAMTEMSGPVMMAFMMDLVNGTGTDGAITNLGAALNLTPEQLEAMQELIGPFAGLIEFMVEPYAELYQEHGVAIMDAFGRTQDRVETLMNPDQIELDEAAIATREAEAVFEARADTGNVVDFNARFTEAAEGADLTNVEVLLETLVEADPELADEVAAIRTNADLMGQFTTWSGMMTDAEVAAASATELYANFNRDIDVRTAVNSTPGLN